MIAETQTNAAIDCVEHYKKFIGQQVALFCARYIYWGIVSEVVGGQYPAIVLANTVVVESTGTANGDKPRKFDVIGNAITVSLASLEILMQSKWVMSKLPARNE